eukprot:symbB.v1.2.038157.t2/scaffold5850.1/size23116/1
MMAIIGMFFQDGLTGSAWGDWANYTASPLRAFENELGVQAPVGFWDPVGFTADGDVAAFKRRRSVELKHGRISMMATMGYITPEVVGKLPGFLSPSAGLKFADIPNGLAAVSKVPVAGWAQIAAYFGFVEFSGGFDDYKTGTPGDYGFKVLTSSDPEEKTKKFWAMSGGYGSDVPTWDGSAASFETFVISCRWFQKSLKENEQKQAASRVWQKLTGPAKAVVRHLNPDEYEDVNGLSRLLDVLRASPLQQLPVPDSFARLEAWHHLRRGERETIPELLVREEDLFVQLQQSLQGARKDKTLARNTATGLGGATTSAESSQQIRHALRTLFADENEKKPSDFRRHGKVWWSEPHDGYDFEEYEAYAEWGEWESSPNSWHDWNEEDAYWTEDWEQDAWWNDHSEDYGEEELQPDEMSELPEEKQYNEAYALAGEAHRTLQEARDAVKRVRQARGYFSPESNTGNGSWIGQRFGNGHRDKALSRVDLFDTSLGSISFYVLGNQAGNTPPLLGARTLRSKKTLLSYATGVFMYENEHDHEKLKTVMMQALDSGHATSPKRLWSYHGMPRSTRPAALFWNILRMECVIWRSLIALADGKSDDVKVQLQLLAQRLQGLQRKIYLKEPNDKQIGISHRRPSRRGMAMHGDPQEHKDSIQPTCSLAIVREELEATVPSSDMTEAKVNGKIMEIKGKMLQVGVPTSLALTMTYEEYIQRLSKYGRADGKPIQSMPKAAPTPKKMIYKAAPETKEGVDPSAAPSEVVPAALQETLRTMEEKIKQEVMEQLSHQKKSGYPTVQPAGEKDVMSVMSVQSSEDEATTGGDSPRDVTCDNPRDVNGSLAETVEQDDGLEVVMPPESSNTTFHYDAKVADGTTLAMDGETFSHTTISKQQSTTNEHGVICHPAPDEVPLIGDFDKCQQSKNNLVGANLAKRLAVKAAMIGAMVLAPTASLMGQLRGASDFLEIACSPESALSNEMIKMGHSAKRINYKEGFDLETRRGTSLLKQEIVQHTPRMSWISLPCTRLSPLVNLTQRTDEEWAAFEKRQSADLRRADEVADGAMHLAAHGHNQTIGPTGFSPFQWTRGSTAPETEIPLGLDPKKAFEGMLKLKVKAKLAYEAEYARSRLSKLNNAIGRPSSTFKTGALVMVWRQRMRPGKTSGRWMGPLRMLLQEGNTLWLATGASLVKAKVNQVRLLTKREEQQSSLEGTAVYKMPVNLDTLMKEFTGKHFTNITGEVPSEQTRQADLGEMDEQLTGKRMTKVQPMMDGADMVTIVDDYQQEPDPGRLLQDRWKGETWFEVRKADRPEKPQAKSKKGIKRKPEFVDEKADDGGVAQAEDPQVQDSEETVIACQLQGGHAGPHIDEENRRFSWTPYYGRVDVEQADSSSSSSEEDSSDEELIPDKEKDKRDDRDRSRSPRSKGEHEDFFLAFDITEEEVTYMANHPSKAKVFLAKAMEKGKEERWSRMSLEEKHRFDLAQAREISNVITSGALRALTAEEKFGLDPKTVMGMRWVLTTKSDNSAKARLVVLGYQAPNLTQVETAAPTMTKLSRNLLLSLSANLGLPMKAGDVTSAFLQASQSLEHEGLTIWAPAELAVAFGASPEDPVMPLRIKRAFYGLCHAPRAWFDHISQTMRGLGFKQMLSDRCLFAIYDQQGEICGLAGLHVDDLLLARNTQNETFNVAYKGLLEAYRWGKWAEKEFDFAGIRVRQAADMSIRVDQELYTLKHIEEIPISAGRSKCLKSEANPYEVSQLRGAIGTIAWRSSQTSPQFQADAGLLLSEIPYATVETLVKTNKLIREMRREASQSLVFPRWNVHWRDLAVVSWADASQKSRPDGSSTMGLITGITPKDFLDGVEHQVAIVTWKSSKTPRQVLGSNGAEVQAVTEAEDSVFRIRALLAELGGVHFDRSNIYEKVRECTTGAVVMDTRGIFDAATRSVSCLHGLRSSRSGYELTLAVIQAIQVQTKFRWVHGGAQLGDGLTKWSSRKVLLQFLVANQWWRLVHDPKFEAGRKVKKKELERQMREREVLTSSDPEEKTKKLSAELANGRLAMMAIIGMFFQDGLTGSAWGDWANYTASPLRAFENELGAQAPLGFWDPLGLSSDGNLYSFKRRRSVEFKHGRISMLATMGYITPEVAGKFPGYISPSNKLLFSDIPNGLGAISKVPLAGWIQILGYCAYCEIGAGYDADINKRTPGDMGWNPPIFSGNDPETKTRRLNAELANGRLAMMAIIGMFFQDGLTGSAWGDWANYTASPLRAFENELGVQAPVGFWDPAGLSSDGSVENFKRRRQTELKHGRISMLATMGYITPEITGKFPGYLSPSAGLKFADVPNGLAAISKVPAAGWGQILAYMAFCEVSQDQSAGTPAAAGDFGWKLITSTDPEVKKTKLNAELANGRLAMMAIIGMFFQDGLTGSAWGDWANYTASPLR